MELQGEEKDTNKQQQQEQQEQETTTSENVTTTTTTESNKEGGEEQQQKQQQYQYDEDEDDTEDFTTERSWEELELQTQYEKYLVMRFKLLCIRIEERLKRSEEWGGIQYNGGPKNKAMRATLVEFLTSCNSWATAFSLQELAKYFYRGMPYGKLRYTDQEKEIRRKCMENVDVTVRNITGYDSVCHPVRNDGVDDEDPRKRIQFRIINLSDLKQKQQSDLRSDKMIEGIENAKRRRAKMYRAIDKRKKLEKQIRRSKRTQMLAERRRALDKKIEEEEAKAQKESEGSGGGTTSE